MKTKTLHHLSIKGLLSVLSIFAAFSVAAQPSYYFTNNTLVSGTDKQQGAIYRFSSVKSGVDALVTIDTLTPGTSIDSLDVNHIGFDAAFQPQVHVAPYTSGYAQFDIQFVSAGTSTPVAQINMPITGIDIDGHASPGDTVAEFDAVNLAATGTVYNLISSTEINVLTNGSWITAKNTGGIEHTDVDTVSQNVMFTVVSPSITSFKVRTGVDNRSGNVLSRNSSVFFQKFIYTGTILPLSTIENFSGSEKDNSIKLQWQLESSNTLSSVSLEKSFDAKSFETLNEYWMNVDDNKTTDFNYSDKVAQTVVYYRLKMLSQSGEVSYSNILAFKSATSEENKFKVYPTVISSTATINISTEKENTAYLQIVDYSGRVVYNQPVQLANGNNNISVGGFGNLPTGNYIAVLRTSNNIYNQKIVKR